MKKKNSGLALIKDLDVIIAGIALVVLVFITLFGAMSRYFLDSPFLWMEEIQLLLEVWVVFLGAGYAFRAGGHVAVELLVESFPEGLQKVVNYFIGIVVLGTLGYLLYQSIGYVNLFINSERSTNLLQIPYTVVYGVVPIACIIMIVSFLFVFFNQIKGIDVTKGGSLE